MIYKFNNKIAKLIIRQYLMKFEFWCYYNLCFIWSEFRISQGTTGLKGQESLSNLQY